VDELAFKEGLKRVAKCKADYLEAEYLIFLETKRPSIQFDPQKLERLRLGSKDAWRAYLQANQRIGREFPSSLQSDLQEYIKSKGHKPRRTYGLVFVSAVLTSLLALGFLFQFAIQMVYAGKSSGPSAALVAMLISFGFWFWWTKKETF
jgi:hypothetical protein